MAYTSEQYKYMLLRRLQRDFSMPSAADRAYTYNFFLRLFEGVTVTEAAYNSFISVMDEELEYCARNGYREAVGIPVNEIQNHTLLLKPSFAALGIDLDIRVDTPVATATFDKPDGTQLTWIVDGSNMISGGSGISNYFYINAKAGREYGYAEKSGRYFRLEDREPGNAGDLDPHNAGPGLTWSYNGASATLTVSGSGSYAGVVADTQLGCGEYATLILGAEVERLLYGCFGSGARPFEHIKTLVILRPEDAPLTLDHDILYYTQRTLDVYTDNRAFRAYSFPSNVTVNWHTLGEWGG